MLDLAPAPRTSATVASEHARQNWQANFAAILSVQPTIADALIAAEPDIEWMFGRDGTLTAIEPDGRWFAGCSVPLLAGRALLSTLEADPLASCLLAPSHVGLVLASRERMGARPAMIVIEPDIRAARVILSCHDFSADILTHRLWFACGSDWARQLRDIFDSYSGLATPARFIRTKLINPDTADGLIADAQAVFSAVLEQRAKKIAEFAAADFVAPPSGKILLIGASQFRLWDNAGQVLQDELGDQDIHQFDTDDPLATSPIALLEAARASGGIVAADICRADSTNAVPLQLPWITWMTRPAAPDFSTAGPRDSLILADPAWRSIARSVGWPEDRVQICGWPGKASSKTEPVRPPTLSIICDTLSIEIPQPIEDFSSHRVLWEMVESELQATPLIVDDPDEYLRNRASQLNIDLATLDRPRFIRQLIIPAFQQGLARILIAAGVPVKIWGAGWAEISEFASICEGSIPDRESFNAAAAASTALVYCWPIKAAHPIETTGKPVVYRTGRETALFVRTAKQLLNISIHPPQSTTPSGRLGQTVLSLLGKRLVRQPIA